MSEKVERAALLNRLRVQKHRENKRRKVEPTISHAEDTCSDGQKDERIAVQLENPTLHRSTDDPSAVDSQALRIESCEDVPLFENINSGGHSILSYDGDSEDDEVDSKLLVPKEVDSVDDAGTPFIGKIRKWASKDVAYIKVDSLLKILKPHHPEVPLSSKTLLKTELQLSHKIRLFNVSNPSDKSEYVYFGIALYVIKYLNEEFHADGIIELRINVDGMSPYKWSALNFWPILGLIHHPLASYRPFVIAAYFGVGKPYSVDLFLDEFIKELNYLLKEGIIIKGRKFEVRVKCFCCDKPARAYLKNIVNHGAYYACERCWVSGIQYLSRVVYPLRDCRPRTNEQFFNQENPEHHLGISPLLRLRDKDNKPLDLVKLFMQEFMHAGPLGIMKKLMLEQWFSDDCKLTREKRMIASLRINNLADQAPIELQRITKDFNKLSLWKAKDFRLVLLYCGPFILRGVISDEQHKHFLLLYVACRILCSRDFLGKFGAQAKIFLDKFVVLSELIYGLEFVVLNPHTLSHLYEDVLNMGCSLSDLDAFIFEGYLSELRHSLRSGNRPLAQVCKKIESDLELNHKKVVSTIALLILNCRQSENLYHVTKLKYLNFELRTKKPDNIILMTDGSLIEIKDLICCSLQVDASKLYVLGEKLQIVGPAFDYPIPSSVLQIFSVKRGHDAELVKYPLSDLSCKVMLCEIFELSSDERQLYTIPLLPTIAS